MGILRGFVSAVSGLRRSGGIFKVIFDRTKDWADLEAMRDAGTLDFDHVAAAIVGMLGADDERLGRLNRLRATLPKGAGRR